MKNQSNHKVHLLAVVLPCLLVLAMLVAPLLSEPAFHRTGFHDLNVFYLRYNHDSIFYDNRVSLPGNNYMTTHNRYFREMEEAGFNIIACPGLYQYNPGYLDELSHDWYDSLQLYPSTWNIDRYGQAQQVPYEVGTGQNDFFHEVCDSCVGVLREDPAPPHPEVFFCDYSVDPAGYAIWDTLPAEDQRSAANYYIEMRIKVDTTNIEADSSDSLITVEFGKLPLPPYDSEILISPNYLDYLKDRPEQSEEVDDVQLDTTILVGGLDLDPIQYQTIRLQHSLASLSFTDRCHHGIRIRIKWHKHADLYIDWVKVYDQWADSLWYEGPTVRNRALAAIRTDMDTMDYLQNLNNSDTLIAGLFTDEPFPAMFQAIGLVDTITRDVFGTGIRYVPNLMALGPYLYDPLWNTIHPPFLSVDPYPLCDSVLYTSTGSPTRSLQNAWDSLTYRHQPQPFTETIFHGGYRPVAEFAEEHNIPWMPFIQVFDWWEVYNDTTEECTSVVHKWRDPTANEIFCQAYLALSFGAKGMQYFVIPTDFKIWGEKVWIDTTHFFWRKHVIPNDSTATKGYYSVRGIFDLVVSVDTIPPHDEIVDTVIQVNYPTLDDFPGVFHDGFLYPNNKYYAIKNFHSELDSFESILLYLDWDNSFCSDSISNYSYIDSVWTSQDHDVDTTFVQVGVFDNPNILEDKYLMFVNRRCLPTEYRTVHFNLNFGSVNANRCLGLTDYLLGSQWVKILQTDGDGKVEDSLMALAPGHGKLIKISGLLGASGPIDTNQVVDWYPDSTHFVTDTLEVKGTLRIHPGTTVKICDCSPGIIIKPGGHLAILGTQENPVTIEGVNPDSLNANIKLWGSGKDTIQYCNIKNLNYGVSFGQNRTVVLKHTTISHCNTGVFSIGDGTLKMDSCIVDGCHWEGIYLQENDDGHIRACTIAGNGEAGVRLSKVNSTFRLGINSIDGNSANFDSTLEAVHIYGCSPEVYGNHIENNNQDGVGAYNESYPVMNKNPEDEGAAENRVTHNGAPEFNHLIYMNSSAGVVITGHNDIFNTEPDTTALIVGEKMPTTAYKMYYNYYGEWQNEPSWAFDFDCVYSWSPKDKAPNTESLIDDPAGFAFSQALYLENEELYTQAAQSYFNLIRNYPSSYLAQASLERILGCYQELNGNIPTLQLVYESIRDTTSHQYLSHKARQMAIKCLTTRRQYDEAISRLENILSESNISFEDSLYTLIDIASVHMLAYYDSLVCSWDPECDSLAGIMSAGGIYRRISQTMASAQSATGNNRRTNPANNNRRISNTATVTRNAGTNVTPTFTQTSVPQGSPIDFGGPYITEQAAYPQNYICTLRPRDEQDYRQRVQKLLALLRGIQTGQNSSQAPPIPENYFLAQNYPNPFNPITTISYGLPEPAHVKITVYDILGRKVITLLEADESAGYHKALWDSKSHQGTEVSSGVYFYRIEANDFVDVKKMVLLR